MRATIRINGELLRSYRLICGYIEQNPNRTDWENVRRKLEREITECVVKQINEKRDE